MTFAFSRSLSFRRRGAFQNAVVALLIGGVLCNAGASQNLRAGPVAVVKPPPVTEEVRVELKNLTLDRAVALAIERNPEILRQLQEIQRAKGVFITARADALPQLVASATYSGQQQRLVSSGSSGALSRFVFAPAAGVPANQAGQLFDSLGNPVTLGQGGQPFNLNDLFGGSGSSSRIPTQNYQIQLQATQFIFTSGRVTHQIRAAQFNEGAQYFALREIVDQTILNVRTGFYQVLLNEALIKIQEENVVLLENQLRDQQNRFAAGTVPRFNVLQAEVQLANQRPQLITARNNFNLAKLSLSRLIGVDSPPDHGRIAAFNVIGRLAYEPRDFNVDQSVAAAIANRSLLKQSRLNIFIGNENMKVALSAYGPTVQANVGVEQRNQRSTDDIGKGINGWFFGATATWNIFDGLSAYGTYKQQRATRNESLIAYDDAVRQVVINVQNSILNIRQSKELIASQVLNVSQAEEAVRLAQARLSAGAGTQLDVLNAQVQLLQAQTTELQARFSYVSNIATYEQATGTSTVYQDSFIDPLTRRAAFPPVPTTGRTTVTVRPGDTPSVALKKQTPERRATGRPAPPAPPKADVERVGIPRPAISHPIDLPLRTNDRMNFQRPPAEGQFRETFTTTTTEVSTTREK